MSCQRQFWGSSRWAFINSFPTLQVYRGGWRPPFTIFLMITLRERVKAIVPDQSWEWGKSKALMGGGLLCWNSVWPNLWGLVVEVIISAWSLYEVKWGRVKMPNIFSRVRSQSRQQLDLEVLLSRRSMGTHTLMTALGEFTPHWRLFSVYLTFCCSATMGIHVG